MLNDHQKSTRALKLLAGRADTNTNKRLHEEPKSSIYVPAENVWSESSYIPPVAPSNLGHMETEGVVQYIEDLVLEPIQGSPHAYKHELLKRCIPEIFGTGYVPVLKDFSGNPLHPMAGDFMIDNFAGILRFYSPVVSAPPKISFFRYVGKTGVIASEKTETENRTIYVRGDGDDYSGDGETASTAFKTLEKALSTIGKRINAGAAVIVDLGEGEFTLNRKCVDYINDLRGEGSLAIMGASVTVIDPNIQGTHREANVYDGRKITAQSTVTVGEVENVTVNGAPANFVENEKVGLLYHNGANYSFIAANTANTISYRGGIGTTTGFICDIKTKISLSTEEFVNPSNIVIATKIYVSFDHLRWELNGLSLTFNLYADFYANIFSNGHLSFMCYREMPLSLYCVFAHDDVTAVTISGNVIIEECYLYNVESEGCKYVANSEFSSIQGKMSFYSGTVIKFCGGTDSAIYEVDGTDIDLRDVTVVFKNKMYAFKLNNYIFYSREQNRILISKYAVLDNCLQPIQASQGALMYPANVMIQGLTFAHEKELINVRLPHYSEALELKVPIGWYINDYAKNDKMILELKLMENTDKNRFYESTLKVTVLPNTQHFTEDYVSSEEDSDPFPVTLDIIRDSNGIIYLTLLATAHNDITDIVGAVYVHDRVTIDTLYL